MMSVLQEQIVDSRPSRASWPRARARTDARRGARHGVRQGVRHGVRRLFRAVRTVFLGVLLLGLAGGLVWLVPLLEEASTSVADDMVLASGPSVPSLRSGLVDFELTEDVEYIVSEGETLSEIARRFEIGYEELADYNALTNPHTIVAGQLIVVPGTFSRRLAEDDRP